MAESESMTSAEVVAETLIAEHSDFLREAVAAVAAQIMEAYVDGVSTRKVDRLVEHLAIRAMSKDRVSAVCRGLDEQVAPFRERPVEAPTPTSGSTPRCIRLCRVSRLAPARGRREERGARTRDGRAS